jgi:hypothetical protein
VQVKQAREREEICMGSGPDFAHSHFFKESCLYMDFMSSNGVMSVGACRKFFLTCLVVVWRCNFVEKEVVFLGATTCSKFIQEACVLVVG